MYFPSRSRSVLIACTVSLPLSAVHAQSSPIAGTSIRGTLTGPDGASIGGASVTVITAGGSTLVASSNTEGDFIVTGLQSGQQYTVVIRALGFETMKRDGVMPGETPVALTLKVDPLQQDITVFAEDEQLKTTPDIALTLSPRSLTQLPSVARNLSQFALLDPRARNTVGSGSDGRQATRLTLNNQSFRFTQYLLDGSTNFDFIFSNGPQQNVSLSAVGEFKLLTNQFPAQYGRASGGIVLVSTKAGSDDFHGEAFFFGRPSGIQAAPPVSTFHVPNSKLQWGSTVGGPIKRGKTNFLLSYEQLHQERGAFIQSPTATFFTGKQDSWFGLARIDHKWNDHQFTTLRLNGDFLTTNNLNDIVGGFVQSSAGRTDIQQSASAQVTQRSLFANWLNDFRFSYANALPVWYTPFNSSISIVRPSYSTTGGSAIEHVRTNTWQVTDTLARTWRSHTFTLGGDYIKVYTNHHLINSQYGTYTFAAGAPTVGQQPLRYVVSVGGSSMKYGQDLMAAYLQDDWKVTSRLTANLGLRYDFQSNANGRANFQPRLGLSWDPFGQGKTIVRAGAGLFYDQLYGQLQRNAINQGPDSTSATYTITNPSYPTPPVISGTSDRRDLYLLSPTLNNPYTMQVSVGIEQQLPAKFVLQIDGAFLASRHQLTLVNLNAPTPFIRTAANPNATRSTTVANATRPYLTYTRSNGTTIPVANVEQVTNGANARNPSLEIQVSRHFGNHFQIQTAYLYSSNITNAFFTGALGSGTPNVWNVTAGENAPSNYYQRNRFIASGIVDLPFAFRLTGTTVAASGMPINPVTGVDNDGDGIAADRPFGLSRNSFTGPKQAQTDFALARTFHVYRHMNLETRAEVSNVLNHSNFVTLTSTYGNTTTPGSSFMKPQAGVQNSDPARQIQFATRILF